MQLSWNKEDNVIAKLEDVQTSVFLALLERSHLIDTLTTNGNLN